MSPREHVVVVGAMGVGKTTVGRLVAAGLGRPLRDSDLDLGAAGGNARVVVRIQGVDALHRWEADHLLAALGEPSPAVVAAAASVVDDPGCLAALNAPFVAWLWAPPEALLARMAAGGSHRRGLGADLLASLKELAQGRDPAYRQVADITIDVGRLTAGQAADTVLRRFDPDGHRPDPRRRP